MFNEQYANLRNKKMPDLWDHVLKNKHLFSNPEFSPELNQDFIFYPDQSLEIIHWQTNYFNDKKAMDLFKV